MSEPKQYNISSLHPYIIEDKNGFMIYYEDYAELKAENARLKAEVERLTSDLQMEKENKDRLVREWQKANNEVYGLQTQVAALIDDQTRLKVEVERLTFDPLTYLDDQGEWMPRHIHLAAVERLQAEVERLRNLATKIDAYVDVLVFENGWLRKAGDDAAKAAMESKQPPNEPSV